MLAAPILLYDLGSRRSQRAIPVKEEVTNTTLEFVDVISHVYYNRKRTGTLPLKNKVLL